MASVNSPDAEGDGGTGVASAHRLAASPVPPPRRRSTIREALRRRLVAVEHLSLPAAVVGSVFGLVLVVYLTLVALAVPGSSRAPWDLDAGGLSWRERLATAGAVATGLGAVVTLVVAYRRQRAIERDHFAVQFAEASTRLGDSAPAVRIAGVYALAVLADQYPAERQQCLDTLCGYLRLPYDPGAGASQRARRSVVAPTPGTGRESTTTDVYSYRAEDREVRLTIIRLIRDHLRDPAGPDSWCGYDFDFTGAIFDGGDFTRVHFTGGRVSFSEACFVGGRTAFGHARFGGGAVAFDAARFCGGTVGFNEAEFCGSRVTFNRAAFASGEVKFSRARFTAGLVAFNKATMTGGRLAFRSAQFAGGMVSFHETAFCEGGVVFDESRVSGGTVSFAEAHLAGDGVSFADAWFAGGRVTFGYADIDSPVRFDRARFVGTEVTFDHATAGAGLVTRDGEELWGAPVPLVRPFDEPDADLGGPAHQPGLATLIRRAVDRSGNR